MCMSAYIFWPLYKNRFKHTIFSSVFTSKYYKPLFFSYLIFVIFRETNLMKKDLIWSWFLRVSRPP